MKPFVCVVGWCILFVLSWPLAFLVLVLAPLIWLLALPFCLVGICVATVFTLLKSLLFLPARCSDIVAKPCGFASATAGRISQRRSWDTGTPKESFATA
jgi:hypothetical protein